MWGSVSDDWTRFSDITTSKLCLCSSTMIVCEHGRTIIVLSIKALDALWPSPKRLSHVHLFKKILHREMSNSEYYDIIAIWCTSRWLFFNIPHIKWRSDLPIFFRFFFAFSSSAAFLMAFLVPAQWTWERFKSCTYATVVVVKDDQKSKRHIVWFIVLCKLSRLNLLWRMTKATVVKQIHECILWSIPTVKPWTDDIRAIT